MSRRREFLKTLAAASVATAASSRRVLGANDRVRVGFIGIGRMGSAIAGRVLEGGHELTVWNRTPEKTTELAGRGAQVASSVAEACARAEAVLTMIRRAQSEGAKD